MRRQLRPKYPGCYDHVTTRGVAPGDLFLNDADRLEFLGRLAQRNPRAAVSAE